MWNDAKKYLELNDLVVDLKCIESSGTYEQLYKMFEDDTNMKEFITNCETNDKITFYDVRKFLVKKYEEEILVFLKSNI